MADDSHNHDVLICGGGVAGVAAALASARAGMKTALVEKTILPGGLATAGLVNVYLPLCDGHGTQVTRGIAEEFLHLCMRYGPGTIPAWQESSPEDAGARYRVAFSPASFVLALDEALEQAGVELWLDALACSPVMAGNRVVGVEVETKEGRGTFSAGCVIDATGDADIAWRAGAPCEEELNSLAIWALEANADAQRAHAMDAQMPGNVTRVRFGKHGRDVQEAECWRGTDARSVTRFALAGRALLRERYRALYEAEGDGMREKRFPVTLPTMAQFRTTRRIVGRTTLQDGEQGRVREDSIGLVADWREPGMVWEIPYGALVPTGVEGVLTAGRCISSAADAWEVTRVIPAAALTGQAVGIAAALAVQKQTPTHSISAVDIQRELDNAGIPFHVSQVYA